MDLNVPSLCGVFQVLPVHVSDEMGLLRHFVSGACSLATGLEVEGAVEQYLSQVHISLGPVILVIEPDVFGDMSWLDISRITLLS